MPITYVTVELNSSNKDAFSLSKRLAKELTKSKYFGKVMTGTKILSKSNGDKSISIRSEYLVSSRKYVKQAFEEAKNAVTNSGFINVKFRDSVIEAYNPIGVNLSIQEGETKQGKEINYFWIIDFLIKE